MDTIETMAFLQKRKKEKKYTKGIRVYVNTFEYDVSKSRARVNKFCEEKEVSSVINQCLTDLLNSFLQRSRNLLTAKATFGRYKGDLVAVFKKFIFNSLFC